MIIRIFFLAAVLFFAGCRRAKTVDSGSPVILSLSAAATWILTELGSPPAAIDSYGVIAAGETVPPVIGKGSAVSRENLAEYGINCAVIWEYQKDANHLFRSCGIRVVELPRFRLKDYPAMILRLGALTGKKKKAEELCDKFERFRSGLKESGESVPVYFELYAPWKSAGSESYIGDLLSVSGGRAVSRKTSLINTEFLMAEAPEIIFYVEGFGSAEEISSRPGFSELPAVKRGRIYSVSRRLITEGIAPEEAILFLRRHLNRRD